MATSTAAAPASSLSTSPYPYAFAPDIIRAHQKDVYFQGLISNHLTDLHRRLLGARSAHTWSSESRTFADLIYLCLTTLLGNRTLGEEYCGLVQVEASKSPHGRRLPSIQRRAAYIAGSILLPYGLTKLLPLIRARIRAFLQRNIQKAEASAQTPSPDAKPSSLKRKAASATSAWSYKVQKYLLENLPTITSPAPIHAVGLALFYFSGSYYELAKRLTGLRYIFTSRAQAGDPVTGEPSADRAGYELLGVLMVVQMSVQAYMHLRSSFASLSPQDSSNGEPSNQVTSLNAHAYAGGSSNNAMMLTELGAAAGGAGQLTRVNIAAVTHTPPPLGCGAEDGVRYCLTDDDSMKWIKGSQQRKCTLCLEELKDPAATQCGHVFCWTCICDWVREKPECPLCRRGALVQHILPLQGF